jgi:regulator of sigma E protease
VLIVVAGPVFNLLFAVGVYAGLFLYGLPEPRPILASPRRALSRTQPACMPAIRCAQVGGEPIETWQELRWRVIQGALQRESLTLEVSNEREAIAHRKLDMTSFPGGGLRGRCTGADRIAAVPPAARPGVRHHRPGSPAERAGLKVG